MDRSPRLGGAVQVVKGEAVELGPTGPGEHDVRLRLGPTDCADVTVSVVGVRLLLNVDGNGRVALWAVRADVPTPTEERHTADLWYGNVVTALAEKADAKDQAKAG